MIGSRRWRSISFWTNGVGTDSSANPSAITNGLTILSQARCCGVSEGDDADPPLIESRVAMSPFSSATTSFQIATNGGSGSVVNETYPL